MNFALGTLLAWSWVAAAARSPDDGTLPPSRFKGLPADVVTALEAMHCRIPQTAGVKTPNNVVKGHFLGSASNEWAVVCLHDQRTHILIFDARGGKPLTMFGEGPGAPYPGDPASRDETSFIATATPRYILQHDSWYGNIPPVPKIDHDGIEVGSEKASVIYYWINGEWRTLSGAD